jgi:hypothetical protein
MTKIEKKLQLKNNFIVFVQKLQFAYLYASMKDVQATGKALSLKREHPTLQNMKFPTFFYFCSLFLPSWIRIPNPDPDPLT